MNLRDLIYNEPKHFSGDQSLPLIGSDDQSDEMMSNSEDSALEGNQDSVRFKRRLNPIFTASDPLSRNLYAKKRPKLYTQSPLVDLQYSDKVKDHYFAPGFSGYWRFNQSSTSQFVFTRSLARTVWDECFCSGDMPGAAMVWPLPSYC